MARIQGGQLFLSFAASVWLAVCGLAAPAERSYGVWWGGRDPLWITLDPEGNRSSVQTPKGPTTTFEYDELGKLTKVTQPPPAAGEPSPVTEYRYDTNRNRIRQIDANGHVVAMEYDDLNRLKKTVQDPTDAGSPEPLVLTTETLQFDENGNPLVVRDPKGQTITSAFDELNRLKTKSYAFAAGDPVRPWRHTTLVEYSYDPNNNLLRQDETVASGTDPPALSASIVRTYDLLDRLASETVPLPDAGSKALSHTYWRNGVRKTTTDPESGLTSYTYDGQNRLQTVTTSLGTSSYTYLADGLLETLSEPDGSVATHSYDKADRVLSVSHTKDASLIASYVYTYDPNGNRLTQVETNGGPAETTSYGYDDLDRLKAITYPDKKVAYGYDAVGNRTGETETTLADELVSNRQGVFDAVNRLETLTDLAKPEGDPARVVSFAYDANGNQTGKTENGVTTTYFYDIRDKLVEVQQGTTATLARFQYDAEGRLLKKIGDDGIRNYFYDQTSRFAEYNDTVTAPVARFHYGSDRLISMWHAGEGARFYHLDGLRSVTALTDTTGAVTARHRLDTWGNFRFPDTDLSTTANRFAFTGHIFETEIGLYYAKARFLDPKLGRFITQDSYLGQIDEPPSLHRYLYAADRPTFYIDPTGHGNETPGAKSNATEDDSKALIERLSDESQPWNQVRPQNAPEAAVVTEQRSDCSGALCPVLEPVIQGGAWLLDNTLGRLTRWWDKRGKEAGGKVREYITSQEPSERLLSGRKQMTQGLPEGILAVDQGTQQLGTKGRETAGELGEAGTRTAVREVGVAVTMAGGSRLLGEAAEGVSQELRGARESGSTATQVGTRRLPNAENPWIKYQQHVTGRSYEEMWRLNAQKVGVDASRAGYTVEAKWAGKNNAAWRSSPSNPRSEFYNERGILDQARDLIELNKTSGGSGVRYAVSNEAARSHFEALFRQHFPGESIQVWHAPGTGMR